MSNWKNKIHFVFKKKKKKIVWANISYVKN